MSLEQELGRGGGMMPPGQLAGGVGGANPLAVMRFIGGGVGLVIILVGLFMVFPLFKEIYSVVKEPDTLSGSVDKWMVVVLGRDSRVASESADAQAVEEIMRGSAGRAVCLLIMILLYLALARIGISVFVGGGKLVAMCTDEMQGVRKLLEQIFRQQSMAATRMKSNTTDT